MNLRDKLARLSGAGLTARPPAPAEPAPIPAHSGWLPSEALTPHGAIHRLLTRLPPTQAHGHIEVAQALAIPGEHLALLALDDTLREVDFSRALYFDTETTGLAGGTGTLPFLVGLAGFEQGSLVVEQLFLRSPGEERALLLRLAERMEQSALWVSFNGKSFDWPLLRTRFVMNRLTPPQPKPHFDLLFACRRIFRHRTQNVRLVELESQVLGFHRLDDIPGAEIPERYFRFLRYGHWAGIAPVLQHNHWDLIALTALSGYLHLALSGEVRHPWDAAALSSVAFRAGDLLRARKLGTWASQSGHPEAASAAFEVLAAVEKKSGQLAQAAEALESAVLHSGGRRRPLVHLELAKLFEHRLKDLSKAHLHASQSASAEAPPNHLRRMQRLERKSGAGLALCNSRKKLG